MQARHRRGAHDAALVRIALPVHVAGQAALAVGEPARENRVGALGVDLGQDQRPGPAGRVVAGRVRAVLGQLVDLVRGAGWQMVDEKRTLAPVVVLGAIGRQAGVDQAAPQQQIELRRIAFVDRHAQRAGERLGGLREFQIGIFDGDLPAWAARLGQVRARRFLVGGKRRRASRRRWRHQAQAVGTLVRGQIAGENARPQFRHVAGPADGGMAGATGGARQRRGDGKYGQDAAPGGAGGRRG